MIITDASTIDFSKYKRLFVFGCSFTQYRWPTWADIIAKDNPHLEYFNTANSGAGNLYIFNQLSQHINHYEMNSEDLVMIMWSTFYREDRYIEHGWKTPGNIYTQGDYDDEFVAKFCCPRGMTIRDLALVDIATRMMISADVHCAQSFCMPYEQQLHYGGQPSQLAEEMRLAEVYDMYGHLPDYMLPSLMDVFPDGWHMEYEYLDHGNMFTDYHPSVTSYADYLAGIGIEISKATLAWVLGDHQRMLAVNTVEELIQNQPRQIL